MNSFNIALHFLGRAIQLENYNLDDLSVELFEGGQVTNDSFNISMFEDSMEASDVNSFGKYILELLESQNLDTRGLDDVPAHSTLPIFIWASLLSILQLFFSDNMFEDSMDASDVNSFSSPRNENNCSVRLSLSKIICFYLIFLKVMLF